MPKRLKRPEDYADYDPLRASRLTVAALTGLLHRIASVLNLTSPEGAEVLSGLRDWCADKEMEKEAKR